MQAEEPHGLTIRIGQQHDSHARFCAREIVGLCLLRSNGQVLRDGSANWSTAGLKRQDNDARFTTNRQEVQEFNQNFEQLWNRPTNTRVQ